MRKRTRLSVRTLVTVGLQLKTSIRTVSEGSLRLCLMRVGSVVTHAELTMIVDCAKHLTVRIGRHQPVSHYVTKKNKRNREEREDEEMGAKICTKCDEEFARLIKGCCNPCYQRRHRKTVCVVDPATKLCTHLKQRERSPFIRCTINSYQLLYPSSSPLKYIINFLRWISQTAQYSSTKR